MKKYCIATVQYPINWEPFLDIVRSSLESAGTGNKLLAYVVVDGRGCYNHGIMLEKEEDKFIEAICMVLQPGKWSSVRDDDPAVKEGMFERCERQNKD